MGCLEGRMRTASSAEEDDDTYRAPKDIFWRPVIAVELMLFIDGLGYFMSLAPQTQMLEDIVCRQYYDIGGNNPNDAPSQRMCKDPAVQDVVAQLLGWQTFFDGIPGLVLAMWFGVLADTLGRRPVFVLSLIGQVFSDCWVLFICWFELPLKLMWLSSFFLIIGGGSTVTGAVAMMVITDASPEAYRSNIFFYSQASIILAELAGPAISSSLMARGLWLPLLLALGCTIITTILAGTIPETLQYRQITSDESRPRDILSESDSLGRTLRRLGQHVGKTLNFILRHRSVLYIVLTFLVVDFSRQSLSVLLQYLSTRYGIPISKANYFLSVRASAQLVTLIAILPLLDIFVSKRLKMPAKPKDFFLSRLSIMFIMTCFAILVVAPNLPVVIAGLAFYTLGNGFSSFARSLVGSLVEDDMVGILFTTLSIMDTVGSLLAGPIVAATFSWSMRLDGIGKGLPYVMSFVLCGLAALSLHLARSDILPANEPEDDNCDGERQPFLQDQSS